MIHVGLTGVFDVGFKVAARRVFGMGAFNVWGSTVVVGGGAVMHALAGTSTGTSTSSGALLRSAALAGTSAATSTSSGDLTVSGASSAYVTAVDVDSPTHHWRVGEPSGTSAVDRIAAANGTYVNTPTLGAAGALLGDADTAVTFTGTDLESVTLPNLTVGTNATLEAWFKTASTGTIFSLFNTSSGTKIQIQVNPRLVVDLVNDAAGTGGAFEDGFPNSNWHYVAVVKTGSSWELFMDGVSADTATLAGTFTFDVATIGRHGQVAAPSYFTGSVDEVAIYSTALSSVRVAAHYTAGTT